MISNNFFLQTQPSWSIEDIVKALGVEKSDVVNGLKSTSIIGVEMLKSASASNVSFFNSRKYLSDLKSTKSGLIIISESDVKDAPSGSALIVVKNPHFSFSILSSKMYKERFDYSGQLTSVSNSAKISSRAVIGSNVTIGDESEIQDNVVIKNGVTIGKKVIIKSGSVIGNGVKIGDGSCIDYNAVIEFSEVGASCHIYSGAKIGQRGFGYAVDKTIPAVIDVPHYGRVIIGDCVDVGANTGIDRGMIDDTVVGSYTKIDNLVQIGHNVKIGMGCAITSQVGIAGSTEIGNFVHIDGQAGINGHIKIGNMVRIMAQSGVVGSLDDGAEVVGSPAIDAKLQKRILMRQIIDAKKKYQKN